MAVIHKFAVVFGFFPMVNLVVAIAGLALNIRQATREKKPMGLMPVFLLVATVVPGALLAFGLATGSGREDLFYKGVFIALVMAVLSLASILKCCWKRTMHAIVYSVAALLISAYWLVGLLYCLGPAAA